MFDVVVLVWLIGIPTLVIEARSMEVLAERVEILRAFEDQPASRNVIHPREIHARKALQLVEDSPLAFVSLGHLSPGLASSLPQDRLKCIQDSAMRSSPFFDNGEIVCSCLSSPYVVASAIHTRLRPNTVQIRSTGVG